MFARTVALALTVAGCATVPPVSANGPAAFASECERWDDWDEPAPPFRVHGDTWHVGTCGISAILVTGPDGHVLIDSGTEAGAPVVLANIRAAGFDPRDVRYLLHSHEHHDHVGGHARIVDATGAEIVASGPAATVFRSGEAQPGDPQYGMLGGMKPIQVNRVIGDGETIRLGPLELTAVATPGHTPGALSWSWRSCDGSGCRALVYADSLSPISADGYRFADHPAFVTAYRDGLERLAALPCEILLTPHPSASGMIERLRARSLVRAEACRDYAAAIEARLDRRLAEER